MGIPKLSKDETLALYKRHAEAQAERAEAAEAALAREESQKRNLFFEREELWAALAEMRRALEPFIRAFDEAVRNHQAKWHYPRDGVTFYATHGMVDKARRALAAAGPACSGEAACEKSECRAGGCILERAAADLNKDGGSDE